jgi:hypothetical protein
MNPQSLVAAKAKSGSGHKIFQSGGVERVRTENYVPHIHKVMGRTICTKPDGKKVREEITGTEKTEHKSE